MKLTCISCPRSCDISVKEQAGGRLEISGNRCKLGADYAQSEYRAPMRMLTTTIAVKGGLHRRLPVISSGAVPKAMLGECLQRLYRLDVALPVNMGDVIERDILGTGADIIAARSMAAGENE